MRALKIAGSAKLPRVAALLVAVAGLGLAGCDDHAGDPKMQIGANPVLPARLLERVGHLKLPRSRE